MDSLLLIGEIDAKLTAFFQKVGYRCLKKTEKEAIPEIIGSEIIDLILLDAQKDPVAHEFVTFIRTQDATRDVPILILSPDKLQTLQVKELHYNKVEILQSPFSLGSVVSKIATLLRIRKMTGRNEEKASLSEVNASLRDLNERHQKELAEARSIQKALLPKSLPTGDSFDVAAVYQPLDDVGGDYYTIEKTESGLIRLLGADVTGHGLSAAFIGSMTKLALVAADKEDPGELLYGMNRLIATVIPQGRFVTANSYLFNPITGELKYARAGGPQAVLLRRSTMETEEIRGDGFPLGFFEEGEYPTGTLMMQKDDVFVVVTDGVTEGLNRSSEFYGFEGLVAAIKETTVEMKAQQILDHMLKHFYSFIDGRILKDDVTVLVLIRR